VVRALRSLPVRMAMAIVALAGIGSLLARVELGRDLRGLDVAVLSGAPEGNYHQVVDRFSDLAQKRRGKVTNLASEGSVDNLSRLVNGRASCNIAFALVQDGQAWPSDPPLQLLGRLPHAETVLLLGKNADSITELSQLRGMKIGIGPAGSGTAKVAKQILESRDLDQLGLKLEPHPLAEQLDLAAQGKLDLAVLVMDADAALVEKAIREQGLQILSFAHADALLNRVPHLHVGKLGAGHYDPVKLLPATDRTVFQVDTLLVSNGCAGRSRTLEFLGVVASVFPEFVHDNLGNPNTTGLEWAPAARSYLDNGGPEAFDAYAPWLADVMPAGKWVYLVTGVSVLFNLMGAGHRFQLWRIDANRVHMEQELTALFGPTTTLGDIRELQPSEKERSPEILAACEQVIHELEALAARSRRMSLSPIVPMGQEMAYRYQESLMHETMAVLRSFLRRAAQPQSSKPAA